MFNIASVIGFFFKNKMLTFLIVFFLSLSIYLFTTFYSMKSIITNNEIETLRADKKKSEQDAIISISEGMNSVKYDVVQNSITTLEVEKFKSVVLDDDYIDPDYGKVFTFGDE